MASARKKTSSKKPLRADAQRSIESVLDAALEVLASDPAASMAEIARRAGVVRATIYVHFPTREELLDAVTMRAIAKVTERVAAAEPAQGEPVDALRRVLLASWRELDRFAGLVPVNMARLSSEKFHDMHRPFLELLYPLVVRGQQTGAFRQGVPPFWHLAMVLALAHAASAEASAGRIAEADVEEAMVRPVLGAVAA
jgi:AcrR family transcriptional regulator